MSECSLPNVFEILIWSLARKTCYSFSPIDKNQENEECQLQKDDPKHLPYIPKYDQRVLLADCILDTKAMAHKEY